MSFVYNRHDSGVDHVKITIRVGNCLPTAKYRSSALSFRRSWFEESGAIAPPRYAHLYGHRPALKALDHLAELSEQEGFEVLAFLMFEPSEIAPGKKRPEMILLDACRDRGFHTLRMQDDIISFVERANGEFTWDLFLESQLAASPANGHPSELLHRMAASKMFSYLETSGVIDALIASD